MTILSASARRARSLPGLVLFELLDEVLPSHELGLDLDLVLVDGAVSVHIDTGDGGPLHDVGNAVAIDVDRHRCRLLHDVGNAVAVDIDDCSGRLTNDVD